MTGPRLLAIARNTSEFFCYAVFDVGAAEKLIYAAGVQSKDAHFVEKHKCLSVGKTHVCSERKQVSQVGYEETDQTCRNNLPIISKRQKSC